MPKKHEWTSSRSIVPKKPSVTFRMTTDNHEVNTVTTENFSPITDISNELSDVKEAECFSGIYF